MQISILNTLPIKQVKETFFKKRIQRKSLCLKNYDAEFEEYEKTFQVPGKLTLRK